MVELIVSRYQSEVATSSQAGEVADAVLHAIVLTTMRVIPFDTEPDAAGVVHIACKSDSPEKTGMIYPRANQRQLLAGHWW